MERKEYDHEILLLQGGGALGAYQAGVYEGLVEWECGGGRDLKKDDVMMTEITKRGLSDNAPADDQHGRQHPCLT